MAVNNLGVLHRSDKYALKLSHVAGDAVAQRGYRE
jgi:hypothetical protein